MADVSQFACLPLGQLIAQPIIEVAKGQAALCNVYLSYLYKLAYEKGKVGGKTNVLTFNLNRPVVDKSGATKTQSVKVEAPLLSLVPVPAFVMQEATVNFSMELKDQTVSQNSSDQEVQSQFGFNYWGCEASITGKVAAHQENSRQSDSSAKYDIYARATQQEPSEGMAKLTSIFASVIEPITTGGK